MSAFWLIFWLAFILLPLLIWLISSIFGKDKGYEKDTSHYWAYKGSSAKVRDANRREVWEHLNPGKKWESRQTGCVIFLVIGLIALFGFSADFIIPFSNSESMSWFQKIAAPVLGGVWAGAFLGIQSLGISKMKSRLFQTLNIITMVVMGLMIFGALVLTFLGMPLPISYHWIWAAVGFSFLLMLFDPLVSKGQQKRADTRQAAATAKGDVLEIWVFKMFDKAFYEGNERGMMNTEFAKMIQGHSLGSDFYITNVNKAVEKLMQGDLYYLKLRGENDFFEDTEVLMLDLISGGQMSIKNSDIYGARDEVIRALQAFYFYMADGPADREIHPRIQAVMDK